MHCKIKNTIMTFYTIQLDERTVAGQSLFQYLDSLGVIIEKLKPQHKSGLDKALDDVKQGRVYHAASTSDMFSQILGNDYVQH